MPPGSSPDNNQGPDLLDIALALFGLGTTLIVLMLVIHDVSFLWSTGSSNGRWGGVPGLLVLIVCMAMAFYPLKRIFISIRKRNDR